MLAKQTTPEKLAADEKQLLDCVNAAIAKHRMPPLNNLAQIFHETAGKIFRSLPEFDHYPNRGPAEFLGLPPDPPRTPPTWPQGEGPRVFAYLKPFKNIETLLTELQKRNQPTIIACDGIAKEHRHKYTTPTMRFVPPTIDIAQVGREAHFAITNANLTTSVRLLIEGCPVMAVPLQLEQTLVANNFRRLGVGVMIRPNSAEDIAPALAQMFENRKYRDAAEAIALKYRGRTDGYVERAVAVLERLLPSSGVTDSPAQAAS
jgi:UDP:flavonoid glycosyltransferase YjiC (YdhE family)